MKSLDLLRGKNMGEINRQLTELRNEVGMDNVNVIGHSYYEIGGAYRVTVLVEYTIGESSKPEIQT